MRGSCGVVGPMVADTRVTALTTRWSNTVIRKPTRSDHDGLSHRAAAAAPRPPGPGSSVCSRARTRDDGSTAAGHIGPGLTTDMPPAGHPSPPRWPLLRAQRRWPQSADGQSCKPLCVAVPRRLAGRAHGPGRAAASAGSQRSSGAPRELFRVLTAVGGLLVWGGALSGTGAPLSGAVDRSGRRPRAASARGPRKRAALIQ